MRLAVEPGNMLADGHLRLAIIQMLAASAAILCEDLVVIHVFQQGPMHLL